MKPEVLIISNYRFEINHYANVYSISIFRIKRTWFHHLKSYYSYNMYLDTEIIEGPISWLLKENPLSLRELESWCNSWILNNQDNYVKEVELV